MIREALECNGSTLKKKNAKEYCCPCPFCGGTDRFCVWPDDNKAWCRGCGWAGDDIQLYIDKDGLSFRDAAVKAGRTDKIKDSPAPKSYGKIVKTYNYIDEEGTLLFQVLRLEPKDFRQRRPGKDNRWIYKLDDTRLVLFNLPNLIESKFVFFVEGEKDAQALQALGLPATCNPMGAGKIRKQQEEHNILNPLRGKTVFLLPDNDKPGREHAEEIAKYLSEMGCLIKIVNLSLAEKGADVSDWLVEHDTHPVEDLRDIIKATPHWIPPKSFYSLQELCDLPDDTNVPIIAGGIMPYNSHIMIAGESGVGKSLLRLEIAIHLAMGWDWQGFKIPRARSVAIFQFENSEHTEKYRIKRMVDGLETNIQAIGDRIRYAKRSERFNLSLKGDRIRLLDQVKALGCEIIIYDCLSNLHSAKENDNIQMREILDVLTDINAELGTACIVIHHFGKPGENPGDNAYRIRGASSIMDWAYTVITFTRKAHEDKILRKIEFVKIRDGKQPKPFIVERDQETFLCRYYDDGSLVTPGLVRGILEDDFNGLVESQRDLVTAIMAKTQCSSRTAQSAIWQAAEYKQIYETGGGRGLKKGYRISMTRTDS